MTLLALVGALSLGVGAAPPGAARSTPEAVADFIAAEAERARLPGVAFAISDRSGVVLAGGRGAQPSACPSLSPDTPFEIGSLTKSFTAVLVLRAQAAGQLDLDAPVSRVLPDFPPTSAVGAATIRQLLHHRSGLAASAGFGAPDRERRVVELRALRASSAPGERFEYSNANYEVLGLVLERVTGLAYPDLVQRDLLGPLDMAHSTAAPSATPDAGLACGHQDWFGFKQVLRGGFAPAIPSAGALRASPRDMGAYLAFHLSATDGGVLTPEQLEALHRPPPGTTYAMGWSARTLGAQPVLLHNGSTPAFTATMVLATEPGLGVVVMTNTNAFPLPFVELSTRRIAADAMRLLLGEQVAAPSPWATWGELATKVGLLAGLLASLAVLVLRQLPRWRRVERAPALVLRGAALDVAMLGGLLLGVPAVFGIPLGALLEFVPDVGWLVVGAASVTALRLGARLALGRARSAGPQRS